MPVAPGLYWKTRLSHACDAALKFVEVLNGRMRRRRSIEKSGAILMTSAQVRACPKALDQLLGWIV
jgi:hypothetical protein